MYGTAEVVVMCSRVSLPQNNKSRITLKSSIQFFAINLLSKISTSLHLQIESCIKKLTPAESTWQQGSFHIDSAHDKLQEIGHPVKEVKAEAQLPQKLATFCIGQCTVAVNTADLQLMLGCACNWTLLVATPTTLNLSAGGVTACLALHMAVL